MKYLSAWVRSFLSGAAVTAIRLLPICRAEGHEADGAIPSRSSHPTVGKVEAGTSGHKLGFVLGVGFGLGIALLFAPKSGAHTRSMIAGRAREGGDYLKQELADLSDRTSDLIGQTRGERSVKAPNNDDEIEA